MRYDMGTFVENVNKLASNLTTEAIDLLDKVLPHLDEIDTVAGSVVNVDTVAGSITNVNTTAGSIANVNAVGTNIANVTATGANITDVGIVASNITDVITVANNVDDVIATAASIGDIVIVGNDLQQAGWSNLLDAGLITDAVTSDPTGISLLETVATNIASVNTVSTNISSVNTTAGSIANVNTVATNIANVNTVATTVVPNMTEILQVNDNAAIAAQAVVDTAALLDQFDDRYLGSKATEPTLDNDGNALQEGALYWDSTLKAMRVWDGASWANALTLTATSTSTMTNKTIDHISNKVGADHIHYPIRNESGSTINAGTVVTASSTQPGTDYIVVVPVTDASTQVALGIMVTSVSNNSTGLCVNTGVVTDVIDTSGWTVGTILYPNSSGGLTSTKPTTGWYQACAVVLRSHATQGTILVEFTEPSRTTYDIIQDMNNISFSVDLGGLV